MDICFTFPDLLQIVPNFDDGKVLDGSKDRAGGDQGTADQEDGQKADELAREQARLVAAVGEPQDQRHERDHQDQLQDQGGFEEGVAGLALGFRVGLVGAKGAAVGGEQFDDDADSQEGGEDAAWVDGGVVGDVVEDSAEGEEVCCFVDGSKIDLIDQHEEVEKIIKKEGWSRRTAQPEATPYSR